MPEETLEGLVRGAMAEIRRRIDATGHLGAEYRHHLEQAEGWLRLAAQRIRTAGQVREARQREDSR